MAEGAAPAAACLIAYHKHPSSAMVRFLRFPWGVTLFEPLPEGADVADDVGAGPALHPSAWARAAAQWLSLDASAVCGDGEFRRRLRLPDGTERPVLLLRMTTTDPPFEAVQRRQGRFVTLMEARDVSMAELDLLRAGYEHLLGG